MQTEFVRYLEEHRALLFKVGAAYCADPVEREDLVQEIAIQLWRAFPRYDRTRKFSTWAFRIALNVAISYGRRAQRRTATLAESRALIEQLPAAHDGDDNLETLLAHVACLNDLDRALVLLYLEGYDHASSAQILGISATNVATKLNRLKERLRSAIAAEHARETPK